MRPWLRALVGVLMLTACAFCLVTVVRDAGGWWRYRTVARCTDGGGCTGDLDGVVKRAYVERAGKAFAHYVTVEVPGRGVEEQDLADPDEVWDALRPGVAVRVRLWKGDVTRVTVEGVGASETSVSPLVVEPLWASYALLFLGFGLGLVNDAWVAAGDGGGWRRAEEPSGFPPAFLIGLVGAVLLAAVRFFDVFDPSALLAVVVVASSAITFAPRGLRDLFA